MGHLLEVVVSLGMIGWIARVVIRVVMDAEVRKAEMRMRMESQGAGAPASEMERLREEIRQLREATTQHALSLQHSVDRLDHRVEFVERTALQSKNGADSASQLFGRS